LISTLTIDGFGDRVSEVQQIVGNKVGKVNTLGMAPDFFHGVQFRSIGRKPFNSEPGVALLEKPIERFIMDAIPIANDDQISVQSAVNSSDEIGKVMSTDVSCLQVIVETYLRTMRWNRQRSDSRYSISPIPYVLNRRMAQRRPSPTPIRLQHKARFVEKNDAIELRIGKVNFVVEIGRLVGERFGFMG
jgi:hypothetical protein